MLHEHHHDRADLPFRRAAALTSAAEPGAVLTHLFTLSRAAVVSGASESDHVGALDR